MSSNETQQNNTKREPCTNLYVCAVGYIYWNWTHVILCYIWGLINWPRILMLELAWCVRCCAWNDRSHCHDLWTPTNPDSWQKSPRTLQFVLVPEKKNRFSSQKVVQFVGAQGMFWNVQNCRGATANHNDLRTCAARSFGFMPIRSSLMQFVENCTIALQEMLFYSGWSTLNIHEMH